LYVVAKNPRQREAAVAFGKACTSGFGKIEEVKDAKVDIEGKDGKYAVKVDGGSLPFPSPRSFAATPTVCRGSQTRLPSKRGEEKVSRPVAPRESRLPFGGRG
jgi:hypothetical protein